MIEIITALLSGIIGFLGGYIVAFLNAQAQFSQVLLEKRMEAYPKLLCITQEIGKKTTSYEEHRKLRDNLKQWQIADHGGWLLLTSQTKQEFDQLKDALKKGPSEGTKNDKQYSQAHLKNLFTMRNKLRGSLADEVRVLRISDSFFNIVSLRK